MTSFTLNLCLWLRICYLHVICGKCMGKLYKNLKKFCRADAVLAMLKVLFQKDIRLVYPSAPMSSRPQIIASANKKYIFVCLHKRLLKMRATVLERTVCFLFARLTSIPMHGCNRTRCDVRARVVVCQKLTCWRSRRVSVPLSRSLRSVGHCFCVNVVILGTHYLCGILRC